jgi:hypothetical protein
MGGAQCATFSNNLPLAPTDAEVLQKFRARVYIKAPSHGFWVDLLSLISHKI